MPALSHRSLVNAYRNTRSQSGSIRVEKKDTKITRDAEPKMSRKISGIHETRLHAAQRVPTDNKAQQVSFVESRRHRLHERWRQQRLLLICPNTNEARRRLQRSGSDRGEIWQTAVHRRVAMQVQIPRQHGAYVRRKTETV